MENSPRLACSAKKILTTNHFLLSTSYIFFVSVVSLFDKVGPFSYILK